MANGHHPHRAITFEDPVAVMPVPSLAYRAGYALGTAWRAARSLAPWILALACWPLTLALLPAVLAYQRGHPHRHGIGVWTLALGWTGTGWLAALWYTLWTWEARPLAGRTAAGLLLVLALPVASPAWAGERPQALTGPVVSVVDGDTIDVQLDGRPVRVRSIGINTPETKHPEKGVEPCGPEASEANRTLVEGNTVRLDLDVQPWDRYQSLLAYVYVGPVMVNAELVRQGYAQVATFPPNVRHVEQFRALQQDARAAGRGCWGMK
jgi:micrococcal nuclease